MLASGNAEAALKLAEEAVTKGLAHPELFRAYADALWDEGDADAALDQLEKLQALQPESAAIKARRGQVLSSSGRMAEAQLAFREALEFNPGCVSALHGLAIKDKSNIDEKYLDKIRRLLDNENLSVGSKGTLHNALAYYYDDCEQWREAAEQMALSNELQSEYHHQRDRDYDIEKHDQYRSQIAEAFSPEFLERTRDCGLDTLEPVFIVGMPRSGTTLTEQIIGRHPLALGIGERNYVSRSLASVHSWAQPELQSHLAAIDEKRVHQIASSYLEQLHALSSKSGKPGVTRIVDKMPDNYNYLGWIVTLFPRAKIIHCKRNPRDVALSCWITQFGKITWAHHLEHLVSRVEAYQASMELWTDRVADHFIEVDYESMVHHQERESKRLIEWLELDWDENCLSFYNSDRLIRTASTNQVREPIYQRSVGRWEHYREYIPELMKIGI